MAEPQITDIASYLSTRLPTEGVAPADAKEAWRHTLRYARTTGAIEPLTALAERLRECLRERSDDTFTQHRLRAEAVLRGIERRVRLQLPAWIAALEAVGEPAPGGFVDWLAIDRHDGQDINVGLYRHAIDRRYRFFSYGDAMLLQRKIHA